MRKTSIGGEALIEGVMMRGPDSMAIAVRKPDGEITIEKRPLKTLAKRYKFFKTPVIRGAVGLFESLILGVKSLMYSAEFVDLEDEEDGEPSKFEQFIERIFGDRLKDIVVFFSVLVSLALSVGLFILVPNFLAELIPFNEESNLQVILIHLFEGSIRMVIFFGYIILISKMKDIRRVFEYHGAEHKTIHCYEHEEELTVENVKKYTTKHPRCGTAFLFVVMMISMVVFSFTGWQTWWVNILLRIALMPLVAGISYEIIKFAGRSESKLMQIVSLPGLALQTFTTREPDGNQIEVAIAALNNVLPQEKEADRW